MKKVFIGLTIKGRAVVARLFHVRYKILAVMLSAAIVLVMCFGVNPKQERVSAAAEWLLLPFAEEALLGLVMVALVGYGMVFDDEADANAAAKACLNDMEESLPDPFLDSKVWLLPGVTNRMALHLTLAQMTFISTWVNDHIDVGQNDNVQAGTIKADNEDFHTWNAFNIISSRYIPTWGSNETGIKQVAVYNDSIGKCYLFNYDPVTEELLRYTVSYTVGQIENATYTYTGKMGSNETIGVIDWNGTYSSHLVITSRPRNSPQNSNGSIVDENIAGYTCTSTSSIYHKLDQPLTFSVFGLDGVVDNPSYRFHLTNSNLDAAVSIPVEEVDPASAEAASGIIVGGKTYVVSDDYVQSDVIGKTAEDVAEQEIDTSVATDITADIADDPAIDYPIADTPSDTEQTDLKAMLLNTFPFCLPWDYVQILKLLVADPVCPEITINWFNGSEVETTVHWSLNDYEGLGTKIHYISYAVCYLGFAMFIIMETRRFIGE